MATRKQIDQEKAKLDAAKAKFREEKKQFETEKRKLESEKKKLKSEKNRMANRQKTMEKDNQKLSRRLMSPQAGSGGDGTFSFGSSPRAGSGPGGDRYQKRYEKEAKKSRDLQSKVGDLEAKIKSLSRKLKYGSKGGGGNAKDLERRMRNLQKELRVQKRKLRLALADMEKTAAFYRKELEQFKKRQVKWLNEQKTQLKKNKIIKYVFADDIKKIQLRKAGRGGGIKIWTKDGDEAVFTDVDVVLPENYVEKGDNPDDYDDILKEVKEDDTLDQEDNEDDLKYEESDEEDDIDDGNDFLKQFVEPLMQELERRMQDIKSIESLIFQAKYMATASQTDGDTIRTAIEELVTSVNERHDKVKEQLKKEEMADDAAGSSSEPDEDGNEEDKLEVQDPEKDMLNTLISNNDDWRDVINEFPFDFISILSYELDDRIIDLSHILKILGDNNEREFNTVKDLMKFVEDRHNTVWNNWNEQTLQTNEDTVDTINNNNDRWRQCLKGTDQVEADAKEAREAARQADMREPTPPPEEKEQYELEWWIFRSNERNEFIQDLSMPDLISDCKENDNDGTESLIAHIARFLNRVIPVSDDIINDYDELSSLYLPITTERCKNDIENIENLSNVTFENAVISSCFDGVLMAILINMIEPDYIDLRAIHMPKEYENDPDNEEKENPNVGKVVPLSDEKIRENIATVLSSIKALDLGLPSWTVDDYFNTALTSTMIVTIFTILYRAMIDSQVNVKLHPELIRLTQTDEEKENASDISSSEWLRRWLIYIRNPVIKRHNRNKSGGGSLVLTINLNEDLGSNGSDGNPRKRPASARPASDNNSSGINALGSNLTPTPDDDVNNNLNSPMSGGAAVARRKLTLSEMTSNSSVMSDTSNGGGTSNGAQNLDLMITNGENIIKYCLPKQNWHQDLLMICSKFDPSFNKLDIINNNPEIYDQCKKILKCVKQVIKVKTIITADDIAALNPLLQEMLISDILDKDSNIEKISQQEKKRLTKIIKPKSKDDASMIAWVNAIGGKGLHINNLDRDLSDGLVLLKLLNKAKPGCVDWKIVRKKVRNMFDKLGNCKHAVDIANNEFPFSLVGIAGNDIVDGNQKYIRTLFWQIMRYISLKQLSELSYGGQNVTDADMLKWANERVLTFSQENKENDDIDPNLLVKKELSSFKDKSLSNSIFYLNLIASINNKWVDFKLIYPIPFDKEGQSELYSKERTANARYTMTIVRRLGGDLFMMNEDICRVENRAVLSLIASIMTIEAKEKEKTKNDDSVQTNNNNNPSDLDAVVADE